MMEDKNITIDDLAGMVQKGFEETAKKGEVSERFDEVNVRFDKIEDRLESIEEKSPSRRFLFRT